MRSMRFLSAPFGCLFSVLFLSLLIVLVPVSVYAESLFPAGTDTVLVIDVSGSMVRSDPDYICRQASLDYVHMLSSAPSRAAVVTFSDTLQAVTSLTDLQSPDGLASIEAQLNAITYTKGDTDIGLAMQAAASILTQESTSERSRCIVLLTDGVIDLPKTENEEASEKESLTNSLLSIETCREEQIVIHTVSPLSSSASELTLCDYMSDSTGGHAHHLSSPAELPQTFSSLAQDALSMTPPSGNSSGIIDSTEIDTEAETEPLSSETEPETETETETELSPIILTTGSIDGPIVLKGLLPELSKATLNLRDVFSLEPSTGDPVTDLSQMKFTAYADDNSVLSCEIKDSILTLSGIKNGSTQVYLKSEYGTQQLENRTQPLESGTQNRTSAQISFASEVQAIFPSLLHLLAIPTGILAAAGLFIFLRKRRWSESMSGTLQWYVKSENEKIFGMPSQTMVNLAEYGSSVRLSEIVHDEYLEGADLHKVLIRENKGDMQIICRTKTCALSRQGMDLTDRMTLSGRTHFHVLCDTGRGKAAVIALFNSGEQAHFPTFGSDEEERTRLLS